MTAPSETRLQSYILAQLSREPGCAVITPNGTVTGDPHARAIFWRQNTGAARTGDRLIRFGIPGQADITGIVAGKRVDIEVKTATGRQSLEQRTYQELATFAGGVYIVARSLEEALDPVRAMLLC